MHMIASSSGGTNAVLIALPAVVGVLVGTVITAVGTAYSTKKKIQEIELTYGQKLQDVYLENARNYMEGVYLPLHLALAELSKSYETFRASVDFDAKTVEASDLRRFKTAVRKFDTAVSDLLARAAGAFLTTELEERLESFNQFVARSLDARETKVTLVIALRAFFIEMAHEGVINKRFPFKSVKLHYFWIPFLPKMLVREDAILQAPLTSRNFEERFIADSIILKALIKEVTLGAHSRTSTRH
jgi:hypothetical protein